MLKNFITNGSKPKIYILKTKLYKKKQKYKQINCLSKTRRYHKLNNNVIIPIKIK